MDFTSFTERISNKILGRLGSGYKVQINDVRKNNGVMLRGLTIMQEGSNVSPTIYLNDYYDEYVNDKTTLADVANDVVDTYNRNKIRGCMNIQYFLDYGHVRQNIIYKFINTERNRELLKDVPHIEILDLSIVFQYMVMHEKFSAASIMIHNEHQKIWNVSIDTLYRDAKENTPKLLPYVIRPLAEVACEVMQEQNPGQFDYDACMAGLSDSIPIFVLSNKARTEGAACMLYQNLLCNFAEEIGSGFYIIPSSIHELLFLPSENADEGERIKDMIRVINDTQVIYEEILSYSLYFFDREQRKVVML
ncbi:MAG: hypothetical protein K2P35_00310 [Lachnospiraceae bacterium]|nr:hypothetical protein [Lachnospiraceae bacterium]NDO52054.1 hypothetical protein [Lachnospiraceae bacterium MD335]